MRGMGREPSLWLLVALVLLQFARPLSGSETFYYRDLYQFFLPSKLFMAGELEKGLLPLWDPRLHGGIPYLASPSNSTLHPFNVLYLFLPPVRAFNLHLIFNYVAAAAGCYWAARGLGCGATASFAAA